MWIYEKRLQFPVDIKKRDPKMAKAIFDALGGADGELAASMEYLQQRYSMPTGQSIATLTDIGTEELAHLEIVSSMIYQLTDGASIDELKKAGLDGYEHLLDLATDDEVVRVLSYLREREVVHFQRFGETLMHVQDFCATNRHFFMDDHH